MNLDDCPECPGLRAENESLRQGQIDRTERANVLWHQEHARAEALEKLVAAAEILQARTATSEDQRVQAARLEYQQARVAGEGE
jgi:hypothetical protein